MKRLILFMILFAIFSIPTLAHPPNKIEVRTDLDNHIVKITAWHLTPKPEKHFINEIEIKLNDEKIITQEFLIQMDKEKQEVNYVIPSMKEGDQITITVKCSVFGKKRISLKAGDVIE